MNFKKNGFFSTLSALLPNLKDFHLGLGSGLKKLDYRVKNIH